MVTGRECFLKKARGDRKGAVISRVRLEHEHLAFVLAEKQKPAFQYALVKKVFVIMRNYAFLKKHLMLALESHEPDVVKPGLFL